jgi:MYXO-CTERM domain-containing protein
LWAPSSGVIFDPGSGVALNFNLASNINRGFENNVGVIHASDSSLGNIGQFVAGQVGFAGIRLGANEYGWVRLRFTNDQTGHVETLTAIDWAINTNGGILAGQTSNQSESSSTPEPNSGAMALLAAGSAGVLAWRRRHHARG